jgi:hypothetical protein
MESKLLEYLPDPNTVKGGIAGLVETIQSEAPLVVGDLLRWHIVYNLSWWIASMVAIVILVYVCKRWLFVWAWSGIKNNEYNAEAVYFIAGIMAPICTIVGFVACWIEHFNWIKPLVAPRVFLIEYFSKMLGS